jgi:hypothetical protein
MELSHRDEPRQTNEQDRLATEVFPKVYPDATQRSRQSQGKVVPYQNESLLPAAVGALRASEKAACSGSCNHYIWLQHSLQGDFELKHCLNACS